MILSEYIEPVTYILGELGVEGGHQGSRYVDLERGDDGEEQHAAESDDPPRPAP